MTINNPRAPELREVIDYERNRQEISLFFEDVANRLNKVSVRQNGGGLVPDSDDAIDVTRSRHTVSASSPDEIKTITGGFDGMELRIHRTGSQTITIKNGTGNIQLAKTGADIALSSNNIVIDLMYDGTNWLET